MKELVEPHGNGTYALDIHAKCLGEGGCTINWPHPSVWHYPHMMNLEQQIASGYRKDGEE